MVFFLYVSCFWIMAMFVLSTYQASTRGMCNELSICTFYSILQPWKVVGAPQMTSQQSLFLLVLFSMANSISVHSLILSSHLFFCLPLLLFPLLCSVLIVFAKKTLCNTCEALMCKLVYLFIVFGERGWYIGNINHLW